MFSDTWHEESKEKRFAQFENSGENMDTVHQLDSPPLPLKVPGHFEMKNVVESH